MQGTAVASVGRLRLPRNRSSSKLPFAPLLAQRIHPAGSTQRRPPIRVPRTASAPPRCRRQPSQRSCLVAKQGQKNRQFLDRGLAAEPASLALPCSRRALGGTSASFAGI